MLKIDKVNKDDLKELMVVLEELSGLPTNFEKFVENYEFINSNDSYFLLGAKMDGKLVGTIMGIVCKDMVGECKSFMVIENVVVLNSARGNGIGRALITKVEDIAIEKNCYCTMLLSSSHRKEAHKFYKAMDYSKDEAYGFRKML